MSVNTGGEFAQTPEDVVIDAFIRTPRLGEAYDSPVGDKPEQMSLDELTGALRRRYDGDPTVRVYEGADGKIYLQYDTEANAYTADLDREPAFDAPAVPRLARTTSAIGMNGVEAVVTEDASDETRPGMRLPTTVVWYGWSVDPQTGRRALKSQRYAMLPDGHEAINTLHIRTGYDWHDGHPGDLSTETDSSDRRTALIALNNALYATESTPGRRLELLAEAQAYADEGYGDVVVSRPDADGHQRVAVTLLDAGSGNFIFTHDIDATGREHAYCMTLMTLNPNPTAGSLEDRTGALALSLFKNDDQGLPTAAERRALLRDESGAWIESGKPTQYVWEHSTYLLPYSGEHPALKRMVRTYGGDVIGDFDFERDVLHSPDAAQANIGALQGLELKDVDMDGEPLSGLKHPGTVFKRLYADGFTADHYLALTIEMIDSGDPDRPTCNVLNAEVIPRDN